MNPVLVPPVLLLPVMMTFTSWRGDEEGGSSPGDGARLLQLEAWWVCTMVPVQEMRAGGGGLFPARTGILLLWSSGVDLGPDSDNALGC